MTPERRAEVQAICDIYDDLPDGAFLAAVQWAGVTIEELAALSEEPSPTEKKGG